MKKILFCSLLVAMFATNNFSQGYVPFPEDSASWVYHDWFANTTVPGQNLYYYYRWHRFYTDGDTIIDSTHYIVLKHDLKEYVDTTINGPVTGTTSPTEIYLFYRNDIPNRKVYKLDPDTGSAEVLWYDFNLAIGDTFHYTPFNHPDTIISIDSVEICGITRARYNYDCGWMTGSVFANIVEGIGNMSGFITNECLEGEHSGYEYQCFVDFTLCNPGNSLCSITIGIEEQENQLIGFYPNPTTDQIQLSETFDGGIIINSMGQNCISFGNSTIVKTETLASGIYTILANKNGKTYHAILIKQ